MSGLFEKNKQSKKPQNIKRRLRRLTADQLVLLLNGKSRPKHLRAAAREELDHREFSYGESAGEDEKEEVRSRKPSYKGRSKPYSKKKVKGGYVLIQNSTNRPLSEDVMNGEKANEYLKKLNR